MESSMRFGLMAVFAVSGSMVFLAHQVHKRLLSNFMKKFEFEMGSEKHHHHHQTKKKVRFATDVMELEVPLENKGYRRNVTSSQKVKAEEVMVMKNIEKWRRGPKLEDIMPPNRAVLYRGIMKYRTLKGRLHF